EGASVKIKIQPPYWKSWWFKGLGIISLMAATGITYRQRLEKVEKERKAQEEFSRKLIELQEDERKRIASALHDTIAQDVTISKNKALMALRHKDDTKRMESALEEISEMASSTIKDVRNITYNLRPHQLDRIGFTKTINSIVNDVSKSTNIKFEFSSDNADDLLSKENEINLFRVIQETINNIMNHSKAKAAKLNISVLENHMLITISDNGTGFNVNSRKIFDAKRGFGLPGIAERIKLMHGELNIESEISKGTTIRIKIPINPK
ncbi:MAG: sensor histidine kinase, partial [Ignavibacteria bacterium]|nr:sensor histidine kinase [Ignavibacteria bacterium]